MTPYCIPLLSCHTLTTADNENVTFEKFSLSVPKEINNNNFLRKICCFFIRNKERENSIIAFPENSSLVKKKKHSFSKQKNKNFCDMPAVDFSPITK